MDSCDKYPTSFCSELKPREVLNFIFVAPTSSCLPPGDVSWSLMNVEELGLVKADGKSVQSGVT